MAFVGATNGDNHSKDSRAAAELLYGSAEWSLLSLVAIDRLHAPKPPSEVNPRFVFFQC